ncbi:MAG: extracellular solute-binding protein [Acetobacteraceae bacterium]
MTRFLSVLAIISALVVATPALAQDPPAVQAAPADQKDALRALIEAAKKDGSVGYFDTVIQPETNDELAAAFRKAYGMPASFAVKYTLSPTLALVTRVEQEVGSGNVTIDIASIASPPWINTLIKGGHVMKYDSPAYQAFGAAFAAGLGKPGYYAFNGAYMFVPTWSADSLDFKGKSWKDVLGAVPPGRISLNDAGNSATGLLAYMGLRSVLGVDYFKDLAKMKPVFIVRSEQTAERLVSGQDLMAFGGMPTRAYQFNERGANLKFLLPKEGVVLLGQASFILAKAPHPNAAKLWLDFTLSEQGQTILSKREALISGRSGFKSPLPEYAPSIDSLTLIKMDWDAIDEAAIRQAKAQWQSIFTP